jgi:hypothetical protein
MQESVVEYIWRYQGLDVHYHPSLDGDGTFLAPYYVQFIRRYFPHKPPFRSAFEWCAGPAFIGFALLAEGLCGRLCVADINPAAIAYARKTIQSGELEKRVVAYVSDNLASVPKEERFDLVVANPPGFFSINPCHQDYERLSSDIKAVDPGWQIRARFYEEIRPHLDTGAYLLIGEVEPFSTIVPSRNNNPIPRDIRPCPPIIEFKKMIERSGLVYVGEGLLCTEGRVNTWILISKAE